MICVVAALRGLPLSFTECELEKVIRQAESVVGDMSGELKMVEESQHH